MAPACITKGGQEQDQTNQGDQTDPFASPKSLTSQGVEIY